MRIGISGICYCRNNDLTGEESRLLWHPVIEFERVMEFKQRPMYGDTDSSVSKIFPKWLWNQNRLNQETFQLTFSCHFHFADFPFDSHECPIEYGSGTLKQEKMRFNVTRAEFSNLSTNSGSDPIILDDLPFPFEFQLVVLPNFGLKNSIKNRTVTFSYTGIALRMRRKSLGQLLSGFFYPSAAFALLSMISFLIKPDMVRFFRRFFFDL